MVLLNKTGKNPVHDFNNLWHNAKNFAYILMNSDEHVRGKLRKALLRSSSGPSMLHHAALSTACSLMELWLHAQIDHKAVMLKNSQFQQIRTQTPVYVPGWCRPTLHHCISLTWNACLSIAVVVVGGEEGGGRHEERWTGAGQRRANREHSESHR